MADIFVSYAQADRDWVKELATALEAEGLSVWWDPNLLPGTRYRDAIQSEMDKAKAVVVVWSRISIESDWVRDEAEDGRQSRKLVPVQKDPVIPPHGFRQLQTANLSQWRGRRENPEFRLLVQGIRALVGKAASVGLPAETVPETKLEPPAADSIWPKTGRKGEPEEAPAPNRKLLAAGVGVALLLIVSGMALYFHLAPFGGPATPVSASASQEDELWDSVKTSNDPAVIQTYLNHYPTGLFADTARAKIASLNKPTAGLAAAPPATAAHDNPEPMPVPPATPLRNVTPAPSPPKPADDDPIGPGGFITPPQR